MLCSTDNGSRESNRRRYAICVLCIVPVLCIGHLFFGTCAYMFACADSLVTSNGDTASPTMSTVSVEDTCDQDKLHEIMLQNSGAELRRAIWTGFPEARLIQLLQNSRDEQSELTIGECLAKFGETSGSVDALCRFISSPRAASKSGKLTDWHYNYAKIELIYYLSRFKTVEARVYLESLLDDKFSAGVVGNWLSGLRGPVDENDQAGWIASVQGRAGVGLMLLDTDESANLVSMAYIRAIEIVKEMQEQQVNGQVVQPDKFALAKSRLDELIGAMAVGDCVNEHGRDVCLNALDSSATTLKVLGRGISNRQDSAYSLAGLEQVSTRP